jgi:polysaccharide deacetylase 2 family uncharacterized protein YibQ
VADDLNTPLGVKKAASRRKLPATAPILAALAAAVLVLGVVWTALIENPLGGEPIAVVTIERPQHKAKEQAAKDEPAKKTAEAPAAPSSAPQPRPASAMPAGSDGGGPLLIKVPQNGPSGISRVLDPALVESSKYGPIPKIAADGRRPAEMFAATTVAEAEDRRPKIAILIGGLGISREQTSAVLERLPRTITLGFTPYGDNLDGLVAQARENGHEIVLQVPMEPFDYPNNDPGPQTLLTSLPAPANIDRLTWAMSRLSGYFGMTSFMGAKFTASKEALAPILTEAGRRGLVFLDTLASPRSTVMELGPETGATVAQAQIVIDATPTAEAIDAALASLEEQARKSGGAIGIASALPVTVDRLEQWTGQLTSKGIALVPVSAVVKRSNPS